MAMIMLMLVLVFFCCCLIISLSGHGGLFVVVSFDNVCSCNFIAGHSGSPTHQRSQLQSNGVHQVGNICDNTINQPNLPSEMDVALCCRLLVHCFTIYTIQTDLIC